MMSANKLSISFHDFDAQGDCCADITLPVSGTVISGFKVKPGMGGRIQVHMPAVMETTWPYPAEIEWAEVRKLITAAYRKESFDPPVSVTLHDFDRENSCLADVTLRETGVVVSDLKVKIGPGGGIMVHMPAWMHTRWSYTEVQWSDVRQAVTQKYLLVAPTKQQPDVAAGTAAAPDKKPLCTFYSSVNKTEAEVTAVIRATGEQIPGIHLVHIKELKNLHIYMPKEMHDQWAGTGMGWNTLSGIIAEEYKRQVLHEDSILPSDAAEILFPRVRNVTACFADVSLPYKKSVIKGFRIRKLEGEEKPIIWTPQWMGRWNDNRLSWYDLCALIAREYSQYSRGDTLPAEPPSTEASSVPAVAPPLPENCTPSSVPADENTPILHAPKQPVREANEFGRVKNAEKSSFIFYPRTVLRAADASDGSPSSPKPLIALVAAMNKDSLGGIGPFEISLLEWIAKLRYVTSTMLVDLIKAGYVSFGWRSGVTRAKLTTITNRMAEYGLISLTRFVTLNEDGSTDGSSCSVMRIITLGKNGSTLLRELGKKGGRYNAFDIFQDGNTVKRILATNQWLIYWLRTYKDEVGENFETSCVIQLKGTEYTGARFYATVTINDCPMVAEPVRRTEDFEAESIKQWLREKIERFALMFDNLDQLYHEKDEISFPQRPIIVLICEDDDHIREIWESIQPVLPKINGQEIWFSSDLRIFNYNKRGERFLHFVDGVPQLVNLKQVLGVDDEAGSAAPTADDGEQAKTLQTVCPQAPADDAD